MASSGSWKPDPEDDDEDDELDETQYRSQKDAVIFAIQVSPSMLQKPEPPQSSDESSNKKKRKKQDTDCATSAALKCAYELMQQRIISNPHDMIGILLYGTEDSKFLEEQLRGTIPHPNCYLLMDLCVPTAEDVKRVRTLVEDDTIFDELIRPSKEEASMSNVLFCANQIFTTRAPNFISRRLFLITDDDCPHEDKRLRSTAAVRARDLYDLGVSIELFPISKPSHAFDRSKFYNDIIYSQSPADPEAPQSTLKEIKAAAAGEGIPLLQSLLSSIKSRAVPKRALFSLPLELGPDFRISVKGYTIFKRQEAARKSYIWLKGEHAQIVQSRPGILRSDRGEEVEKAELRKAYKFGGAQIPFTRDEIAKLRNFGDPVIRILGFKPSSMLPFWANIKNSTFVYPSEDGWIGSTRVFSALHQKMLKDSLMALAWFVPRRNATPTIAALLPGAEKLNDEIEQVLPAGLWIIPLPFADDIRKDPEIPYVVAPDSVIDSMRQIVQLLQLPKAAYFPERYPNPALQWHYRILQALALDEDVPTEPADSTVPKYRQIDKRVGEYVQEWGGALETAHRQWQTDNQQGASASAFTALGSKRPAAPTSALHSVGVADRTKNKRVKTEDGELGDTGSTGTGSGAGAGAGAVGITDETVRMLWEKGRLERLKVADMKAWLAGKGVKLARAAGSMKKADLQDQVEQLLERK